MFFPFTGQGSVIYKALNLMTVHEIIWYLVRATDEYKTWWYCEWKGETVVKGTRIPSQAWTDPESSRSLRLPDFKTVGT
jgi:hypothetical protein